MLTIVKADIYRIFRGKGVYITFAALLLFILLQVSSGSVGTVGVVTVGENVSTANENIENISRTFTGIYATEMFLSTADNLIYFLLPFIFFVVVADFSSGCVKNVLSQGVSRVKYYMAKLLLASLFTTVCLLLYVLLPLAAGTAMHGFGESPTNFISTFLKTFVSLYFMFIAATALGVSIAFITKRAAAVNSLYLAFFMLPLIILLSLGMLSPDIAELSKYEFVTCLRALGSYSPLTSADIIRSLSVGAVVLFGSILLANSIFSKSEIK